MLKEVAAHNYKLVQSVFRHDVPRTALVTAAQARQRVQGLGREPVFSLSGMDTGQALLHFARQLRSARAVVCGLNFANGENVGGGYLHGAQAQEEDLCRQFPALYTSLTRAKDHGGAYPFGPCTCRDVRDPQHYASVLFTPRLVPRRGSRAEGFRILEDHEAADNVALVSAAAPNRRANQIFDNELVLQAMRTILVAPRLQEDSRVDTLVLGAWGCGAFGCDASQVARLFAKVLMEERLGRLYREVHFAIPRGPRGGHNAQIFEQVFRDCRMPLVVESLVPTSMV